MCIRDRGSYTALKTNGMDMVKAFNLLEVNAMTSHWEFTLGIERVMELVDNHLNFPFLGANIFDTEWDERAFEPYTFTEQNGKKIAIIGQAFPVHLLGRSSHIRVSISCRSFYRLRYW